MVDPVKEIGICDIHFPPPDICPALPKKAPGGLSDIPTTLEISAPPPQERASGGLLDWIIDAIWGSPAPQVEASPAESISYPLKPKLAPPSAQVSRQAEQLIETMRNQNRITAKTLEDLKDPTEGQLYKSMISLIKDVIAFNETLLKQSLEDSQEKREAVKKLHTALRDISKELESVKGKETIAKTAQTALNIIAAGTILFVIGSAVWTSGLTAAAIPAVFQGLTTTGASVAQATVGAAQATTQATRTYLEGKRQQSESASLANRHQESEIFFEFKLSRDEWNQFTKLITNFWSSLKEIENKRRETNRYIGG